MESSSRRAFEGRRPDVSLETVLEKCLTTLPVDLTALLRLIDTRWRDFLADNFIDRLLFTLLNENDERISSFTTKSQILAALMSLVRRDHSGMLRVRLALQAVSVWFKWEDDSKKDAELIKGLVDVMTTAWRIRSPTKERMLKDVLARTAIEHIKTEIQAQFSATQFQAAVRGFLSRRRLKRVLLSASHEQQKRLEDWSVVLIQKLARGYIARKTVVRKMLIRNQLSREVLRLGEKYLVNGDLWSFLREINEELTRSKKELHSTEVREEQWASTFVDNVLERRQREFEKAWSSLPIALSNVKGDLSPFGTLTQHQPAHELPGPLLRRAVTQTMKSEVQSALSTALQTDLKCQLLSQNIERAYRQSARPPPGTLPALRASQKNKSKKLGSSLVKAPMSKDKESLGRIRANADNWLAINSTDQFMQDDLLSRDVPLGMGDSLERLIHAAALRCYVPDFFAPGVDGGRSAYEQYLRLPPGLAKARYELECRQWSQGTVNHLRVQGMNQIAQVGPVSKFVHCLKGVSAPSELIRKCADLFLDLKNTQKCAQGLTSLAPVDSAVPSSPLRPASRPVAPSVSTIPSIVAILSQQEPLHSSPLSPSAPSEMASRLLQEMIESVNANSQTSTVEEVFVNAAFLILPHHGPAEDMGQHAFQEFATDLVDFVDSDSHREDLIRRRFRAAIMLTTPFTLALKEKGVITTKDLMGTDLRSLGLPAALFAQLEIFFNSLNYRQANARILPVLRDHASQRKPAEFMVPMFYDTRYQRSPLDPHGKTPLPSKQMMMRKDPQKDPLSTGDLSKPASLFAANSGNDSSSSTPSVPQSWQFAVPGGLNAPKGTLASTGNVKVASKARTKTRVDPTATSISRVAKVYADPAVFKETHVCHYPNCHQVFSRAYTYKVHLKTHEMFPHYHEFKREPQLGLDHVGTV